MAVRHDRKQAALASAEIAKGHAWAIFFKLNEIHEVFTGALEQVARAEAAATEKGANLWQTLQFSPHDHRDISWETPELLLLIDHKKLSFMTEYQQATVWLTNLNHSIKLYREMRVEFLTSQPSVMTGQSGEMQLTQEQYNAVMPTISHLATLADSMAEVVKAQQPDLRALLKEYAKVMKGMIGKSPELEFQDENKQGISQAGAAPAGS